MSAMSLKSIIQLSVCIKILHWFYLFVLELIHFCCARNNLIYWRYFIEISSEIAEVLLFLIFSWKLLCEWYMCQILPEKKINTLLKVSCLFFYVWYRYAANLENNKRVDLFDGGNEDLNEENVWLASCMAWTFLSYILFIFLIHHCLSDMNWLVVQLIFFD